ncbi:amino-acid N-acetyltransferase [Melghirimyces profundicolus]|uniref:Amino-acid N-acetyltransferase n=1 Tax=Melghirimyces profundicolus TaxID=1242148 RepID=A0A2T6C2F8_9BACL|nr:hypothetical protein [Melghirimyces profundicolus]PTX62500.1 amino-acid N-acetyltransferase [Melghirimyces profundicolus]
MFTVRRANHSDRETIVRLLRQAGLSADGTDAHLENFLIVEDPVSRRELGTVGLEIYGDRGLLRSFVMESDAWNAKTGMELIAVVLTYARKTGLKEVYLMAGITASIFEHFGFEPVDWEELPEEIRHSAHKREVEPGEGVPMVCRNPAVRSPAEG